MSIWFALLVPIIGIVVMAVFFKKDMTWWELILPLAVSVIFIGISKVVTEKIAMTDTEYHGALIVKAQYYEYYETWVQKTCSHTTYSGSGKHRTSHTVYYDCSYCDVHQPEWKVVNSLGESFSVSSGYYNQLIKKWHGKPQFVELNRHIDYHNSWGRSYGKDGDMYQFEWDKVALSAISSTTEHSYENRVKAAHSSFDFMDVTEQDIKAYSLYDYPKVDGMSQETVLGLDSVKWMTPKDKGLMRQWSTYINGYYGKTKHARVYFLFFANRPEIAGRYQEALWEGGNDNELVICIGLNTSGNGISWVYPFTWSPQRQIIPDIRQGIMESGKFDPKQIATVTIRYIGKEWKRRHFEEFSYIRVEPPLWAKIMTWIVTLLITGGVCYWSITNDYVADENSPLKTKEKRRNIRW